MLHCSIAPARQPEAPARASARLLPALRAGELFSKRLVFAMAIAPLLVPWSQLVAAQEPADACMRFLIAILDKPIKEIDKGEIALPNPIDKLCAEVSAPGADKNPKKRVVIVVSLDPLESVALVEHKPIQIRIFTKLVGARLDSILDLICSQIDGVVLVRDDFIEIVPRELALKEIGIEVPIPDDWPPSGNNPIGPILARQPLCPPLIHAFFSKVTLDKALQQISKRYNQNIILSPQADAKAATLVTARLVNVPLESAVESLANSADLRVVRQANVYFVTTKEQAAEMKNEQVKKAKPL